MKVFLTILPVLFLALDVRAENIEAKKCVMEFEASAEPVVVKILGKSETECEGSFSVEGGKVTASNFTLKLDKVDTGNRLRNKHLREKYLITEKFPIATLKILSAEDVDAQLAGKKKDASKFEGELELHGEKNKIENGTYTVEGNKIQAKFAIDLPNWKVDRPSFMGVTVVDKVKITVRFEK